MAKHIIKCSLCDKTFPNGAPYRKHWEEAHLDYALEYSKKLKNKCGTMNGKKEKITLRGVIQMFTKKLLQVATYLKESRPVTLTCAWLKQLLGVCISLKWPIHFLIIFGTVGFAWLVLYYPTLVQTVGCLSAVLVLMLLIRSRI